MSSTASPDPFVEFIEALYATARHAYSQMPSVYGLTRFEPGPRALGELAMTDDHTDRVGLVYGDPNGSGMIVQIHTTASSPQAALRSLRYGDEEDEAASRDEPHDDDEMPWFKRWEPTLPAGEISLPVGDKLVAFVRRRNEDVWYASAILPGGESGLIIEAVNVEPETLTITEVTDIELYVDGHRRMIRGAWPS